MDIVFLLLEIEFLLILNSRAAVLFFHHSVNHVFNLFSF